MLPLINFRIKNIKGGEATFDKRFLKVLVDAFLSDFLNKNLCTDLKDLNVYFRKIYKCIEIFHFLHTKRVFSLQDFLSKS